METSDWINQEVEQGRTDWEPEFPPALLGVWTLRTHRYMCPVAIECDSEQEAVELAADLTERCEGFPLQVVRPDGTKIERTELDRRIAALWRY